MKSFLVTNAEQVRALASPIRSHILEVLRTKGEQSVSEIAKAIGESSAAAHYHVNKLVEAGLVVESGKRRVGPRMERLFRPVARNIKIAPQGNSAEYSEALLDLALATVRRLERELAVAYTSSELAKSDVPPARIVVRKGFVSVRDVPRVQALLEEAAHLLGPIRTKSKNLEMVLRSFLVRLPSDEKRRTSR